MFNINCDVTYIVVVLVMLKWCAHFLWLPLVSISVVLMGAQSSCLHPTLIPYSSVYHRWELCHTLIVNASLMVMCSIIKVICLLINQLCY